ncbi:MAG: twin-arginine translocase subunit TatC [Sphaerochaetaceae bacterium]|nr:twin-arginine translocase subunit TatC [Sphaerochaetaceae bacterium]MDC7246826.1 twin-arginine translocase subunit TatC [Sphaerochaetaceae bacterium]
MNEEEDVMPILSHLAELRRCVIISIIALLVGFVVAWSFYDIIIDFLFMPLTDLVEEGEDILYVNTFTEAFLVQMKISALAGLIISSPVHVVNILSFIFPGLVKKEKQVILIILFTSFFFIIASFFYSYYSIIPVMITFLTSSGFIPKNTGMLLNFGGNIFYILQFMLMALVVFQLPIVLEMLLMMDVVKRKSLLKSGRYVVVLFFIVAAIITPPDFITQIGLALPMTALYFLTILIAKIFGFGEE